MHSDLKAATGVVILFLGLYGLTFHGFVDIEDVEVSYQSTRNLVENGSLAIGDTELGRKIIRERFYVVEGADGYYPVYPLVQLLLPLPFYLGGKALAPVAREKPEDIVRMVYSTTNVFAGAFTCLAVFLLSRSLRFSVRIALGCTLLTGTCTMLWAYAQSSFPDTILSFFFCASTYCLVRGFIGGMERPDQQTGKLPASTSQSSWLVAAGALHALAALVRPVGFLLFLPAVFYLRHGNRSSWLSFFLPVVILITLVGSLDLVAFDRPLAASYAASAWNNPPVLTHSYTLSLLGLLLSDGGGLFMLSPILSLAVLGFPSFLRRWPHEGKLLLGQFSTLVLFFAGFAGWYGGWSWGPRYLLPCVPLLGVLVGHWLLSKGRWRRVLTVGLVVISLWIQMLSVAVPHRIYMTAVSLPGGDLTQFFFYTRFSPVLVHQRILVDKLTGGDDIYSLRDLLHLPDDRTFDATRIPHEEISRYSRGFDHFAWIRVYKKGYPVAALAGALVCLSSIATGSWVLWRVSRHPDAS